MDSTSQPTKLSLLSGNPTKVGTGTVPDRIAGLYPVSGSATNSHYQFYRH